MGEDSARPIDYSVSDQTFDIVTEDSTRPIDYSVVSDIRVASTPSIST